MKAAHFFADGVTLLALILLLPPLSTRLATQSGLNVLWLGSGYVLFCLGVYWLRKLEPAPGASPAFWLGRRARIALGVLFGLAMTTAVAWQLGFFDIVLATNSIQFDEGEAASFFVLAPSAWLALSLFYVIVLAFDLTPTIGRVAKGYSWLALAGLLGVNVMLLLGTAQMQAVRADLQAGNRLLWFIGSYFVLLLLFGPPRLLYAARQPHPSVIATFLALLAYCAWQIAAYTREAF